MSPKNCESSSIAYLWCREYWTFVFLSSINNVGLEAFSARPGAARLNQHPIKARKP